MKRVLIVVIAFLLCLSAFLVPAPQAKVEPTNPSPPSGLYAGSTNPGKVWEYKGGTSWESITEQPSELGWSVTSIVEFEGKLYAASISDPDLYSSSGKVYRYDGDKIWTPVVSGLTANQVTFLVVYKDELYAGTATPARLYKYNSATTSWSIALEYTPWFGFRSAYVWGNWLYLGEWYYDRFARWDGTTFEVFQPYHWGSCIYSFEEYGDYLYAGAYEGSLYKITSEPPTATKIWNPPQWQYAWTLKKFKDNLYIGLDAGWTGTALLYRYDGSSFSQVWSYSTTTSNPHEGIISMTTDGRYLYLGVGGQAVGYPTYMSGAGTGKVYKSSDGLNFELASGTIGTGIQILYYAYEIALPVPYFNQADAPWGSQQYDHLTLQDHPNPTIAHCGCALTSAAMISRYYGVDKSPTGEPTNPGTLNEWLKANQGYVESGPMKGHIKWPSIASYSAEANKKFGTPIIKWIGFGKGSDFITLNNELYNYRPVILQVRDPKYGGHFVVATGIVGSTYTINDPGWRTRTTLEAYTNKFEGMCLFAPTTTDLSTIYIVTPSPTKIFLVDSSGRRVGEDPISGTIYNEIPNSFYFSEVLSDLPEITVLAIINPPADDFKVMVSGFTDEYDISFSGYDRDGNITTQDLSSVRGQEYVLSYSPEPGSQISVSQVVETDIKPGSEPNSINPESRGVIPVAILTTDSFNALTVDIESVEFGRGKAKAIRASFEDVNNDGDLDLVLHFKTQEVKIEQGDTQVYLSGRTKDGVSIIGWDSIRVVP